MELIATDKKFEALNTELNAPEQLLAYKRPYEDYHVQIIPRILGTFLVWCGNFVYGHKPSYLKFRAVEVIARIPYQSWSSAAYTLMTLFYANEKKAMELSKLTQHARFSLDNETMHVIVVSHITKEHEKAGFFRHTFVPMVFAFFYFWWTYWFYLLRPRWSYELNYMFEQHAFDQYSEFIETYEEELKKRPVSSEFLAWYGRHPRSQYEFFQSVRNDEIIHRNQSVGAIDFEADAKRIRFLRSSAAFIVLVVVIVIVSILLFT
ncbi:MAG TPA: alternative oxidase [Candidatus Paceibacterota bacterium]|nr:alternative oxidase [Candidatus Paceibacterota bacterium]